LACSNSRILTNEAAGPYIGSFRCLHEDNRRCLRSCISFAVRAKEPSFEQTHRQSGTL
jgi:hypothetical protein